MSYDEYNPSLVPVHSPNHSVPLENPRPAVTFDPVICCGVPTELRALKQWVVWGWVWSAQVSRWTKVPLTVSGQHASSTNPATWASFDSCLAAQAIGGYAGVGFVFTADDPFCGIDLDHARDPVTGAWDTLLGAFLCQLRSYTELSQSGTGFHIIVRARLPDKGRKWQPYGSGGPTLEIYDRSRYFCTTGDHLGGFPTTVEDRQRVVSEGVLPIITPKPAPERQRVPLMAGGSNVVGGRDAQTIIRHLRRDSERFEQLFRGELADKPSESEADQAYCWYIATRTRDPQVIDEAFRLSARLRGKWEREDYRAATIQHALEHAEMKPLIYGAEIAR